MKITTIRHGETDWNVQKRPQGSVDIELNENGIKQAMRLAERLAAQPCDVIYTSDLKRAKKTAEIINNHHGKAMITSPNLRESGFGKFEGQILKDTEMYNAFVAFMDERAPAHFAKVYAYMDEILQNNPHEHIFIVSHFGTIRAVICYLLQTPIEDRGLYHIGNTAIHTFEKEDDGGFRMILENDFRHLK